MKNPKEDSKVDNGHPLGGAGDESNKNTDSKPIDKKAEIIFNFAPPNPIASFNDLAMEDSKLYLTKDRTKYIEFCYVTKGNFNVGITPDQYSEVLNDAGDRAFGLNVQDEVAKKSDRYIIIDESFHIAKYELSMEEYNLVMDGKTVDDSRPKNMWTDKELQKFIEKLNKTFPNLIFDIPTELEWEYAAKGASEKLYISSNDYFDVADYVNTLEDSIGMRSVEVEKQLCSWINACDMLGNLKEVCYANHEVYTSVANTSMKYCARGGSYIEDRFSARTTSRHIRSSISGEDIGIRLIIKKKN